MVEMSIFPTVCIMASCAIAGVMPLRLDCSMTGFALLRGAGEGTLGMAGFTFQPGMPACQWEEGMLCAAAAGQEGYRARIDFLSLRLAAFWRCLQGRD
jgi:hypothetical protein